MSVPGGQYKIVPHHSAATADANGTALAVINQPGAFSIWRVQISGTFVGTIYFEGTIDGTNWEGVELQDQEASATKAVSATAPGMWWGVVSGLVQVRARLDWDSGTSVTVTGVLVA